MLKCHLQPRSTFVSPAGALLDAAGRWFLGSGIQQRNGGVARYYVSDSNQNVRVSTEITGYAASFLCYLYLETGRASCLDCARRAGRYLLEAAWDPASATYPFEPVSAGQPAYAYFFDCGIVVRGLLALWRATGDADYLARAKECGLSMAFDFPADEAMHPILTLPDKQPLAHEPRWSRQPGCYQLKAAMAWHDLAQATGRTELARLYERSLADSLANHDRFLAAEPDPERTMDRLHAYAYFLEGLLPAIATPGLQPADRAVDALQRGIHRIAGLHRDIAPAFERSDVCAQLLRLRLFADLLGAAPLDQSAAREEAARAAEFRIESGDPRLEGGFWFGRRNGRMMGFVNPVSTAFCAQALSMWSRFQEGSLEPGLAQLV
jgi:hypothetical protein